MKKQEYLTVTALNKYIKRKFDNDPHLEFIYVKGEVSNYKKHTSGHLYFTLKEAGVVIKAVMFARDFRNVKFEIENGMKVLVAGNVTLYENTCDVQIYVKQLKVDGLGDLFVAFEQMKLKLEREGLFHDHHKKKLPAYPETIGIITAKDGAALRDILTTIRRRYPIVNIVIIPAIVQGNFAVDSIVNGIQRANLESTIDVIILGRGGGSIEDLWAFNEEKVARAVFSSKIPIVSAVGHETDVTVTDFVADLRAPTPTGAAEIVTPNQIELKNGLRNKTVRLDYLIAEKIKVKRDKLTFFGKSYAFRIPKIILQKKEQHLLLISERVETLFRQKIVKAKKDSSFVGMKLKHQNPSNLILNGRQRVKEQNKYLHERIKYQIKTNRHLFLQQYIQLKGIDPLKIFQKGYGLLHDKNKNIVKSVHSINLADTIEIKLVDGQIDCSVERIKENNYEK